MNSLSSDLVVAAIVRTGQRDPLEIQGLRADVLLVRPLDCAEGDIYLFEIVQILQFPEDLVVQIRLSIKSLGTPIIELQVQREIIIRSYSRNLVHLASYWAARLFSLALPLRFDLEMATGACRFARV